MSWPLWPLETFDSWASAWHGASSPCLQKASVWYSASSLRYSHCGCRHQAGLALTPNPANAMIPDALPAARHASAYLGHCAHEQSVLSLLAAFALPKSLYVESLATFQPATHPWLFVCREPHLL